MSFEVASFDVDVFLHCGNSWKLEFGFLYVWWQAWLKRTVLEPCAVAAKSGDARDKYFAVGVGSFDPAAGAQLRSELPGLEAADAALAAAVTELAEIVPDAHACKKKGVAFSKKGKSREGSSRRLLGAAELAEQKALFDEAKQTILSARRLLQK